MDPDEFLKLAAALASEGVDYVLVGGLAVSLHGLIRATEDIDLFVDPSDENVERLRRALVAVWNDPDLADLEASEFSAEYPTLRYGPPESDAIIDIITRIGTQFTYDQLSYETIELDGVPIRVATPTTLIAMKKGTDRAIDRADVEALERRFGASNEGETQ